MANEWPTMKVYLTPLLETGWRLQEISVADSCLEDAQQFRFDTRRVLQKLGSVYPLEGTARIFWLPDPYTGRFEYAWTWRSGKATVVVFNKEIPWLEQWFAGDIDTIAAFPYSAALRAATSQKR